MPRRKVAHLLVFCLPPPLESLSQVWVPACAVALLLYAGTLAVSGYGFGGLRDALFPPAMPAGGPDPPLGPGLSAAGLALSDPRYWRLGPAGGEAAAGGEAPVLGWGAEGGWLAGACGVAFFASAARNACSLAFLRSPAQRPVVFCVMLVGVSGGGSVSAEHSRPPLRLHTCFT